MENQNKLSDSEVNDLRKSLSILGMEESEIVDYIEKALSEENEKSKREKGEETGTEKTMEEKAEGGKKDEPEDLEKACDSLKLQKAELEKSIDEMEAKMGKKKDVEKSIEVDFEKSFGERFADIEKSLSDKFEDQFTEMNDIIKGLRDEVQKIGDTPINTKAVITQANFFKKGSEDDLSGGEAKTLSISKDKDEILKGMQDLLNKEDNADVRQLLSDGISDYTINTQPTSHGVRALAHLSRKNNIALEQ